MQSQKFRAIFTRGAVLGLMLLAGSPVMAGSTWALNANGTNCGIANGGGSASNGAIASCGTSSGVTATMQAWSTGTGASGSTTSSADFNQAKLYNWGTNGFGVVATNEDPSATGPHATDNRYGTDAMLLNFSTAQTLTSLTIGWNGTENATGSYVDSDLSIFAWVGGSSTTPAQMTTALDGIGPGGSGSTAMPSSTTTTLNGWVWIGNYADVGSLANNTLNVSSSVSSSYWLISAYNSSYGAIAGGADANVDAFKLTAITSDTKKVPEPTSIAIFGAALLGMVGVRRRARAAGRVQQPA